MNLLLRVLFINNREIFKYLDYDDHKNLSLAFMDNYIIFLLDRINYRKNAGRDHYFEYDFNLKKRVKKVVDYDFIVKMVLESININRLKSKTLNLHRGFWNHISLNCKLKEKFVYKWNHKINICFLDHFQTNLKLVFQVLKCVNRVLDVLKIQPTFFVQFFSILNGCAKIVCTTMNRRLSMMTRIIYLRIAIGLKMTHYEDWGDEE